jgi:hypothetical protein
VHRTIVGKQINLLERIEFHGWGIALRETTEHLTAPAPADTWLAYFLLVDR